MENPLKIDENFSPCRVAAGDELFPNGIFVFNITRIIEYIRKNPDSIALQEVDVGDFPKAFSSINESDVDPVEIFKPVILAEISPGQYSLIDGHHRVEKARRMGISNIRAYKLNAEQHMRFLISQEAYVVYVGYWNSKLKDMGKMGRPHNNKNRRTKRSTFFAVIFCCMVPCGTDPAELMAEKLDSRGNQNGFENQTKRSLSVW